MMTPAALLASPISSVLLSAPRSRVRIVTVCPYRLSVLGPLIVSAVLPL